MCNIKMQYVITTNTTFYLLFDVSWTVSFSLATYNESHPIRSVFVFFFFFIFSTSPSHSACLQQHKTDEVSFRSTLFCLFLLLLSLSLTLSFSSLLFSQTASLSRWVTSRLRFVWEEESVFKCPCWREDREKESYKILLHLISYSFHACDSPFYYLPFRSSVLEKFPSIVFLRVCPLLNLTAKCSSAWADNWLP